MATVDEPIGLKSVRPRKDLTGGAIGYHPAASGTIVSVTWLPLTPTHVHVIAWVEGDQTVAPQQTPNVARVQATRETHKLLAAM
jgi:hypothetical protein